MAHLSKWSRARSAAVAAVCVVSAATVLATDALAADGGERDKRGKHGCVDVRGVTEQTVKYSTIGTDEPPMQEVGDTATYYDVIYDENDNIIGDAVGFVTITGRRPSDGHLISDYQEAVHLPQGTFRDSATGIDRNGMIAGEWLHFAAIGTTGEFAGKYGYRRWQLIPPLSDPPIPSQRAAVVIRLCG